MASPSSLLEARVRELESAIRSRFARKRQLAGELEGLQMASDVAREQLDILAAQVPEAMGSRRRMGVLMLAADEPPTTTAREAAWALAGARARAGRRAAFMRELMEAEMHS